VTLAPAIVPAPWLALQIWPVGWEAMLTE